MNPTVERHPEYRRTLGLPPVSDSAMPASDVLLSKLIEHASQAPAVNTQTPSPEPAPLPAMIAAAYEMICADLCEEMQANSDLLLEVAQLEQRHATRRAEQRTAKQSQRENRMSDRDGIKAARRQKVRPGSRKRDAPKPHSSHRTQLTSASGEHGHGGPRQRTANRAGP